LNIDYHFASFDAVFSLPVKDGLTTIYVGHPRPLHVSVELVILYQPALAGCVDGFLMCHNL
jgi:hypothetical protein